MLRKSIFIFTFLVGFSSAYALPPVEQSPEMKCISRCVGTFGWENVEACVEVCTPD